MDNLRVAIRNLRKQPAFTLIAVLVLALGIGVNSTIFTVLNTVLFRPLPGVDPHARLVWVTGVRPMEFADGGLSYPDYAALQDASGKVFTDIFAYAHTPLHISGDEANAARIRGQVVSGMYFRSLGVSPAAGRFFSNEEVKTAATATPVVVLAYGLWMRRYGGDAAVIGRSIRINGRPFTVIGVAPKGFSGPELAASADVWVPLSTYRWTMPGRDALTEVSNWLSVMARLTPAVSMKDASAAVKLVSDRRNAAEPDPTRHIRMNVVSATGGFMPAQRNELAPLAILQHLMAGLVLLIACANVANLTLVRTAGRRHELAVRAALGAGRTQLIRQMLTESVVYALLGGTVGVLLSLWGAESILRALDPSAFGGVSAVLDLRVAAFGLAVTLFTAVAFGLLPALRASRADPLGAIKHENSALRGRTRTQGMLVVAQLALSLVLLMAAGVTLRALQRSRSLALGFEPRGVMTLSFDPVVQGYDERGRTALLDEMLRRVRALPGAEAAAANVVPLSGRMVGNAVRLTGDGQPDSEIMAFINAVSEDWFRTMRIPVVRGREFLATDRVGSPDVVVVNETAAARFWPGANALGKRIAVGDRGEAEVVGVAADSKMDEAGESPHSMVYMPLPQRSVQPEITLFVRAPDQTAALAESVRAEFRTLDPDLPVYDVRAMTDIVRNRPDRARDMSIILTVAGVLALLLAAVGVYGVMSYTVVQRTREIGIRMALGAEARAVRSLVVGDSVRLSLFGLAVGTVLAVPFALLLSRVVSGTRLQDAPAILAVGLVLVITAGLAAWLPARRASRIEPLAALRTE